MKGWNMIHKIRKKEKKRGQKKGPSLLLTLINIELLFTSMLLVFQLYF